MSLQETKFLLQAHQIAPNKLMGQNFMVVPSVFPKLACYASIDADDIVLDAGAGLGFLDCFLANRCRAVFAVEKDPKLAKILREQIQRSPNVTVIEGDVLKTAIPFFTKAISIPPYYLSSHLVLWLLDRSFECAALIMQKEFADRLVATVGGDQFGWLTVATYQGAETELLDSVPKWMFYPQPKVDSVIVRLTQWKSQPFKVNNVLLFRRLTKWLFTQRNKKLRNGLEPFIRTEFKVGKADAEKMATACPMVERRVRELAPQDFGAIANALSK